MNDPNTTRSVGLDVHKETIAVAVADGALPAKVLSTIPNDLATLLRTLRRLGPPGSIASCYEAGPTGYGLYRQLKAAGYTCHVVAPSMVPVQSGCRIKTDRRDAAKLAHYLRSGDLTSIYVLDEVTEAIRDLERARDDAKIAERVARHHLSKFLLRHGRVYPGKTAWNAPHMAWVAGQEFTQPAQRQVLADYREAVELAGARVGRLTARMGEALQTWERAPLVKAFQALRGVDMVSAVTLVAEVGDFRRFATAGELMAFVGLVPSEHSSGGSRRQGRITRTGNGHVRRIVVESAWHDRRQPRMSKAIRLRNDAVSAGGRASARLEGPEAAARAPQPAPGPEQAGVPGGGRGGAGAGRFRLGDLARGGAPGRIGSSREIPEVGRTASVRRPGGQSPASGRFGGTLVPALGRRSGADART